MDRLLTQKQVIGRGCPLLFYLSDLRHDHGMTFSEIDTEDDDTAAQYGFVAR